MRLSFQTAGIIFGVTLTHVFVISAFSPVPVDDGANTQPAVARPRIVLDPELESLLDADVSDLLVDAAGVVIEDEPAGTRTHPYPGGESVATTTPPAEPAALPAPNLAGNEGHPEPTLRKSSSLDPAPAIREIRTINPVPRS